MSTVKMAPEARVEAVENIARELLATWITASARYPDIDTPVMIVALSRLAAAALAASAGHGQELHCLQIFQEQVADKFLDFIEQPRLTAMRAELARKRGAPKT